MVKAYFRDSKGNRIVETFSVINQAEKYAEIYELTLVHHVDIESVNYDKLFQNCLES